MRHLLDTEQVPIDHTIGVDPGEVFNVMESGAAWGDLDEDFAVYEAPAPEVISQQELANILGSAVSV